MGSVGPGQRPAGGPHAGPRNITEAAMQTRFPGRILAAGALALLAAAAPARPAALQSRHDEFIEKFRQAMSINAKDEMAKLVKSYADEAVARVVYTCEQIADRDSDELETLRAALDEAWRASFDTGFVDAVYRYFSFLDPAVKRERARMKDSYDRLVARYTDAAAKKDGPALELAANEAQGLADSFAKIGDHYYASQLWLLYAKCLDSPLRDDRANFEKAAEGYRKMIAEREAIELKDHTYHEGKARAEQLVKEGWVAPPAGGPAEPATPEEPAPAEPEPAPPAAPAPMEFALLDDPDAIERPSYTADDLYPMWNGLFLGPKGSKAHFAAMQDKGPEVVRLGSSDLRVDANRDGNVEDDARIPITGKLTPVEVTIGSGAEERRWAFLATTGVQQDYYQGIQINLQPDDDHFSLYTISAASVVGTIAGVPVRVIDDNMDGVYGSPPQLWGYVGLSADMTQPDLDSIVIGSSKHALPWSEYQKIGDQWYRLEALKGGKELQATPVTLPTGELKLDFKGGKPSWVVVQGLDKLSGAFFDLTASKTVEVPVGRYRLLCGELRKGKKRQTSKCLILPGKATPNWTVAKGETAVAQLGAPFSFSFHFTRDGDRLQVEGKSVVVTGSASERYERPWNAVPRPEVSWRKAGSRHGSKGEEMDIVMDNDKITQLGWAAAWAPLDITVELHGLAAGEAVEVQLAEKKNPLFGKVESAWQGGG
jgi:hypothetical protein